MVKNNVEKFFMKLAEHLDVSINYRWKTELFNKIGQLIEIGSANRISGWILRGHIPNHSIQKILKLDMPEDLKTLCRLCAKEKKAPGKGAESDHDRLKRKCTLQQEVIELYKKIVLLQDENQKLKTENKKLKKQTAED